MEKEKSGISREIVSIVKSCLLGLVVSLIGTVVLAVVLKFADIPSKVVSYINDIIKALSIFFVVLVLKKSTDEKLLVRAVIAGAVYGLLSFVIFSILNGGFHFSLSILFDLIFAVVVAIVASIIFKLTSKKTA